MIKKKKNPQMVPTLVISHIFCGWKRTENRRDERLSVGEVESERRGRFVKYLVAIAIGKTLLIRQLNHFFSNPLSQFSVVNEKNKCYHTSG